MLVNERSKEKEEQMNNKSSETTYLSSKCNKSRQKIHKELSNV